jgi:hypothetical protein
MSSSLASTACSFGVASCSRKSNIVNEALLSNMNSLTKQNRKRTKRREANLASNTLEGCPACAIIVTPEKRDSSQLSSSLAEMDCYLSHQEDSTHHRGRHRQRRLGKQTLHSLILLPFLLTILLLPSCSASPGDRSPEYQSCVESCKLDSCFVSSDWPDWDDGTARTTRLPLILRLTGWSCIDDCKYHCTHRVTNEAYDRVTKIRQDSIRIVGGEAAKMSWSQAEQRKKIEELVSLRLAALTKGDGTISWKVGFHPVLGSARAFECPLQPAKLSSPLSSSINTPKASPRHVPSQIGLYPARSPELQRLVLVSYIPH